MCVCAHVCVCMHVHVCTRVCMHVCVLISLTAVIPYPCNKVNLSVITILTYLILLTLFSDVAKTTLADKEAWHCFKHVREQKLYLSIRLQCAFVIIGVTSLECNFKTNSCR